MYRLPFELTDSAKLLHFTILGGPQTPPAPPPLNDATGCERPLLSLSCTRVHVLYVLRFYVLIVILHVLLRCHVRRNKDTPLTLECVKQHVRHYADYAFV